MSHLGHGILSLLLIHVPLYSGSQKERAVNLTDRTSPDTRCHSATLLNKLPLKFYLNNSVDIDN